MALRMFVMEAMNYLCFRVYDSQLLHHFIMNAKINEGESLISYRYPERHAREPAREGSP
jgi:hypothetical protein